MFKIVFATAAAAIALAGMPSQATVISAPANHATASTWLIANQSGTWVEMDFRMLSERNGSALPAFGMGMDLNAEWFGDEAILQDAIDTFVRMPPGAGGRPPNIDSDAIVYHSRAQASTASNIRQPEPVSLALVAVGLLGIGAGISKYLSAPARARI